jgi:hypothetical protein
MKIYKMIWYLTVLPALKAADPSYESFITLIDQRYSVQNEELRSLSLGDLDEFKVLEQ